MLGEGRTTAGHVVTAADIGSRVTDYLVIALVVAAVLMVAGITGLLLTRRSRREGRHR